MSKIELKVDSLEKFCSNKISESMKEMKNEVNDIKIDVYPEHELSYLLPRQGPHSQVLCILKAGEVWRSSNGISRKQLRQ